MRIREGQPGHSCLGVRDSRRICLSKVDREAAALSAVWRSGRSTFPNRLSASRPLFQGLSDGFAAVSSPVLRAGTEQFAIAPENQHILSFLEQASGFLAALHLFRKCAPLLSKLPQATNNVLQKNHPGNTKQAKQIQQQQQTGSNPDSSSSLPGINHSVSGQTWSVVNN